ncbi:MAG: hypothetical protein AAF745_16705 [Planctomycetota bacterium]
MAATQIRDIKPSAKVADPTRIIIDMLESLLQAEEHILGVGFG